MKKTVLLATVCALFLSSCSLFGPGQEEAYDYIKDIMVKYKEKPSDVNAKDFYSDFEGKKVRLNNFAILGIAKIPITNQREFNEETADRPQPVYRLYLAPMKTINGKTVAFGGLLYRENDDNYVLHPNVFSPIDMVDSDLKSLVITADIFDEKQIESIEALQTIFVDQKLYGSSIIDSIITAKGIEDENNSHELGLNFLLNSIDVTVEFPKFVEDYNFTPISSGQLALNVVEVNEIRRLDSPGRKLFETYFTADYKELRNNLMSLMFDGLGIDGLSLIRAGYAPIEKKDLTGYFDDEVGYHSTNLGSRIKLVRQASIGNIALGNAFGNGCVFWGGLSDKLGIKQIKDININYTQDVLSHKDEHPEGIQDSYKGTMFNGQPKDGVFIGNFTELFLTPLFGSTCVSESTKKQYNTVKGILDFFGHNTYYLDGNFTFNKGVCSEISYQNLGPEKYYLTLKFSEQNQILSIEQNILNATTSVDPTNKTIFMEYTPPNSAKSYTRTLSSETGEVVTPVADSVTQPAQ